MTAYSAAARRTALGAAQGPGSHIYLTLGLCGEVGEIAEKVKKLIRDGDGTWDAERLALFHKELGDVYWYLARLADESGSSLSAIAQMNIDKLSDRQQRGVLGGSGDTR
jgi:NTP pyrophosphatase (non-canonical NTP hydrolase)